MFGKGWEILREAIEAAGRPSTPLWMPPPEARGGTGTVDAAAGRNGGTVEPTNKRREIRYKGEGGLVKKNLDILFVWMCLR